MSYTTRSTCRACGSSSLEELFSLGAQYVSDFVDVQPPESAKVPIDIVQCRACTLVQQLHTAPSDFMYTRHYWYRSSQTLSMQAHLAELAVELTSYLQPGDRVLDIGSNDGTFLRKVKAAARQRGLAVECVGVEPASNLVGEGRRGLDLLISDFWSYGAVQAAGLDDAKFKVVTALGMLYDLEDPNQFVRDVAQVLHPNGVFVAQLMCAWNMHSMLDVGNLCHEHLEFYTLKSLDMLFAKYGLEIFDVQTNSCNGQSYRLFVRHKRERSSFLPWLAAEQSIEWSATWKSWYQRLCEQRDKCRTFVAAHDDVWVYGASTKGNVILQWYDMPSLRFAADKSAEKRGLYTVGSNLLIFSEEDARKVARYFLVLPYAFVDEFVEREAAWHSRGRKFLVPLPEFTVC